MERKITVVVGAGSTFSDASTKPLKHRPPLDSGFFKSCGDLRLTEKLWLIRYLKENYDIDPTMPEHDSLERMMAIIYADINNPNLESGAAAAFRELIRLFNRRIAETTNRIKTTNHCNLYRILGKLLKGGCKPSNIAIVTFNQDLQIEKILSKLKITRRYNRHGNIFKFPECYGFEHPLPEVSSPIQSSEPIFSKSSEADDGIRVFKLHGSLNWYSIHNSREVPKKAILNSKKKFKITSRADIPVGMRQNSGKRRQHTFPLIIPPVNHKAAIIHEKLHPIWKKAEDVLMNSTEIIVFGYSCPSTDFESANLLRRAARTGTIPSSFVVIDPNPDVFQRYVKITNLDHLSYFRSADSYILKG